MDPGDLSQTPALGLPALHIPTPWSGCRTGLNRSNELATGKSSIDAGSHVVSQSMTVMKCVAVDRFLHAGNNSVSESLLLRSICVYYNRRLAYLLWEVTGISDIEGR